MPYSVKIHSRTIMRKNFLKSGLPASAEGIAKYLASFEASKNQVAYTKLTNLEIDRNTGELISSSFDFRVYDKKDIELVNYIKNGNFNINKSITSIVESWIQ